MIPRYGEAIDRSQSYRARPGVYAILPRCGKILVTFQLDLDWELQLPGGGIDPGESPLLALHREVLEETGWRIARPRHIGVFRRFVFMEDYGFWAEKICHLYLAHPVIQIAEPLEAEHRSFWLSLSDAALELGSAGDRRFAKAYANGHLP